MDAQNVKEVFLKIGKTMKENKDYLIELDAQNGDGDLGLSMDNGFTSVNAFLSSFDEPDLGALFMKIGGVFNESCSSSLGTILSFGMMGMARRLKGKTSADLRELAEAFESGANTIMEKAGSKPGEKTVLDSLCPAIEALKNALSSDSNALSAFLAAKNAAAQGSQSTRAMRSVHGRAAYYGDKSIGVLDGGSVAGKLIFDAIYSYLTDL